MPPSVEVSVSTELRIPMLVEQQRELRNAVFLCGACPKSVFSNVSDAAKYEQECGLYSPCFLKASMFLSPPLDLTCYKGG